MRAGIVARVLSALVAALIGWQMGSEVGTAGAQTRNSLIGVVLGGLGGSIALPGLLQKPYHSARRKVACIGIERLVAGTAGLVLGLIIAALVAYPLSFIPWRFGHVVPAATALIFGYLGIALITMRHRDLADLLRMHRNPPEVPLPTMQRQRCLVDTSAIIDGRLADVGDTGFLLFTLVIPHFVLIELQHIADSSDALRRSRGKRGLEALSRLHENPKTHVEILDVHVPDAPDVDAKLVKLARDLDVPVITNDFNLNRVAGLLSVQVLNVNQLSHALKPVVLPGETLSVEIVQEGKELHQGVGYLDDGTMIVVENGRRHLNRTIDIAVTRVLQTIAGRMIFAQPKSDGAE